jgi:hypothetical protein
MVHAFQAQRVGVICERGLAGVPSPDGARRALWPRPGGPVRSVRAPWAQTVPDRSSTDRNSFLQHLGQNRYVPPSASPGRRQRGSGSTAARPGRRAVKVPVGRGSCPFGSSPLFFRLGTNRVRRSVEGQQLRPVGTLHWGFTRCKSPRKNNSMCAAQRAAFILRSFGTSQETWMANGGVR